MDLHHVEFWQGEADRRHSRIVYESTVDGWTRTISGRAVDQTGQGSRT